MSGFGASQHSHLEIVYQPGTTPPTYFANIAQTWIVGDDVYLDFCLRSPSKPLIRADLQCRIITSRENLKRLAQGLTALVERWESQLAATREAEERIARTCASPGGGDGACTGG